jgi:hypothetical protein
MAQKTGNSSTHAAPDLASGHTATVEVAPDRPGPGAAKPRTQSLQEVREFLHPKSMLTPGIAGGIAMMIANTLGVAFGLPRAWAALAISILLGLLLGATPGPLWQRGVYGALNTLVIFSFAFGAANVLATPNTQCATGPHKFVQVPSVALARAWARHEQPAVETPSLRRREEEVERRERELQRRETELKRLDKPAPELRDARPGSRKFFEKWNF